MSWVPTRPGGYCDEVCGCCDKRGDFCDDEDAAGDMLVLWNTAGDVWERGDERMICGNGRTAAGEV